MTTKQTRYLWLCNFRIILLSNRFSFLFLPQVFFWVFMFGDCLFNFMLYWFWVGDCWRGNINIHYITNMPRSWLCCLCIPFDCVDSSTQFDCVESCTPIDCVDSSTPFDCVDSCTSFDCVDSCTPFDCIDSCTLLYCVDSCTPFE